jgi:hypothetical protein
MLCLFAACPLLGASIFPQCLSFCGLSAAWGYNFSSMLFVLRLVRCSGLQLFLNAFLLRLVRCSGLQLFLNAFRFAACPLLGASTFPQCFSLNKTLIINLLQNIISYFTSFCLIISQGFFFDFVERLHSRIPAAVGLLCVGFCWRVGVSAVFHEGFFFFIFFFNT